MEKAYCSRECQVTDWKEHKQICKSTTKAILMVYARKISPVPRQGTVTKWTKNGRAFFSPKVFAITHEFHWYLDVNGCIVPANIVDFEGNFPALRFPDLVDVGEVTAEIRSGTQSEGLGILNLFPKKDISHKEVHHQEVDCILHYIQNELDAVKRANWGVLCENAKLAEETKAELARMSHTQLDNLMEEIIVNTFDSKWEFSSIATKAKQLQEAFRVKYTD